MALCLRCMIIGFAIRQGRAKSYPLAVASVHGHRARRSPLPPYSTTSSKSSSRIRRVLLASSTVKGTKNTSSRTPTTSSQQDIQEANREFDYTELGMVGRIVGGSVEVAVSTMLEYLSGFFGGYFLGTVTDIPRLLFRTTDASVRKTFLKESASRFIRLHDKSLQWGTNWGSISAAFGGFKVLAKVVRGGKEDEWNTVFSSMAAGAFFARKGKPSRLSSLDLSSCYHSG